MDCCADPRGARFDGQLRVELQKVAAFYVEKEEELAAAMSRLSLSSSPQVGLPAHCRAAGPTHRRVTRTCCGRHALSCLLLLLAQHALP